MFFAPVQTTLPDENNKADVLGSFILIINPGNCSGLYSTLGNVDAIFSKCNLCSRSVVTTRFTTLILAILSPIITFTVIFK